MSNTYQATGSNAPSSRAEVRALARTIEFDGSQSMGEEVPGPAHLLAGALAACVLKNVERFSHLLPFAYTSASVVVTLERQDAPPRIVRAAYELEIETEETTWRAGLLLRNIQKFGTVSNTLALACDVSASLRVKRMDGTVETVEKVASSS